MSDKEVKPDRRRSIVEQMAKVMDPKDLIENGEERKKRFTRILCQELPLDAEGKVEEMVEDAARLALQGSFQEAWVKSAVSEKKRETYERLEKEIEKKSENLTPKDVPVYLLGDVNDQNEDRIEGTILKGKRGLWNERKKKRVTAKRDEVGKALVVFNEGGSISANRIREEAFGGNKYREAQLIINFLWEKGIIKAKNWRRFGKHTTVSFVLEDDSVKLGDVMPKSMEAPEDDVPDLAVGGEGEEPDLDITVKEEDEGEEELEPLEKEDEKDKIESLNGGEEELLDPIGMKDEVLSTLGRLEGKNGASLSDVATEMDEPISRTEEILGVLLNEDKVYESSAGRFKRLG